MKYARIFNEFYSTVWAIMPAKLQVMMEFINAKAFDQVPPPFSGQAHGEAVIPKTGTYLLGKSERVVCRDTSAAAHGAASAPVSGAIAVLPVYGVINQRMDLISYYSGGTSTESISKTFKKMLADDSVGTIVLDVDSPGGNVYGVMELAAEIYKARSKKRVVAIANSLSASAAYWIGTAAEEFYVTPGGEAGSIGVVMAHVDESKLEESIGVKTTLISAGKYKVEGNSHEPLNDEAYEWFQNRANGYYDEFVAAVARHRGAKVADVRGGFGEGRVVSAKEATSLSMADGVMAFDELIAYLTPKNSRRRAGARLSLEELNAVR